MFIQQVIIEHLLCAKHYVIAKPPVTRSTDMVPAPWGSQPNMRNKQALKTVITATVEKG